MFGIENWKERNGIYSISLVCLVLKRMEKRNKSIPFPSKQFSILKRENERKETKSHVERIEKKRRVDAIPTFESYSD